MRYREFFYCSAVTNNHVKIAKIKVTVMVGVEEACINYEELQLYKFEMFR